MQQLECSEQSYFLATRARLPYTAVVACTYLIAARSFQHGRTMYFIFYTCILQHLMGPQGRVRVCVSGSVCLPNLCMQRVPQNQV